MTQYNTLNIKLPNSNSNSGISNDEAIFLYKLLLTNTQVLKLCQLSQIIHQLIKYYQKLSYIK